MLVLVRTYDLAGTLTLLCLLLVLSTNSLIHFYTHQETTPIKCGHLNTYMRTVNSSVSGHSISVALWIVVRNYGALYWAYSALQDCRIGSTSNNFISNNCLTTITSSVCKLQLSHDYHMIITWLSHDYHMIITGSSHDYHMIITWSSHDYHMTITGSSHDYHMTITWPSPTSTHTNTTPVPCWQLSHVLHIYWCDSWWPPG